MENQSGISLVELITALSIISVTGLFCSPTIFSFRENLQFQDEVLQLVQNLEVAKYEAIKNNCAVAVLFNDRGYSIFVDDGAGGGVANNYVQETGEQEIVHRTLDEKIKITQNFSVNRTRFSGLPGNKVGTITFIGNGGIRKSNVILSRVGRIRVEKVM